MSTVDSVLQSGVSAETDSTFLALRTSIRPLEYQGTKANPRLLGHYRAFAQSSALAPAANSALGAFRYGDPNSLAVITRIYALLSVVTAVTAQRTDPLIATIARAYTVRDLTNATPVVLTGNNAKVRTSMGPTTVGINGNMDVSNLAAGLTGGTKTLDVNAIGAADLANLAAIGSGSLSVDLYKWDQLGQHPLVLAAFEGIILSWGPTALATGTVTVGFGVDWAEVASF